MKIIPIILVSLSFITCQQELSKNEDKKPRKGYNQDPKKVEVDSFYLTYNNKLPPPDTSNQLIYDFLKMVIKDQNLDLNSGLDIEPIEYYDIGKTAEQFFKENQIGVKQPKKEPSNLEDLDIVSFHSLDFETLLSLDEIEFMLREKKKIKQFKWDNKRLGFDLENSNYWYLFSIPLINKDETVAVIRYSHLCGGLCGGGQTLIYTKEKRKWMPHVVGMWIH